MRNTPKFDKILFYGLCLLIFGLAGLAWMLNDILRMVVR